MMHRAVFRMLATAWLLGIANPQSIKRLGHFFDGGLQIRRDA